MVRLRASLGFILAAISITAAAPTHRRAFDSLPPDTLYGLPARW